MKSSTLKFNEPAGFKLVGCGVDIEEPKRFIKWVESPPTTVFSTNEINYFSTIKNPIEQMSAAFSLKEALYKSLQKPYNFPECQLLKFTLNRPLNLNFSDSFKSEYLISYGEYRINRTEIGEIIVELSIFNNNQ